MYILFVNIPTLKVTHPMIDLGMPRINAPKLAFFVSRTPTLEV